MLTMFKVLSLSPMTKTKVRFSGCSHPLLPFQLPLGDDAAKSP
jgi:hypothetical protein